MNKKVKIAIDIDEILRSKARQFHRYYVEEFGEEGVPENPFTLDFFNEYKWNDVVETTKVLRDDIEIDKINAISYHDDDGDGDIPVDSVIFNTEKVELTAKDVYNRFLYQDFVFEIFGSAQKTYKDVDLDFAKFIKKYDKFVDFTIISKENYFTIPPTLFFLSKVMSRCTKYIFYKKLEEISDFDFYFTTNPNIINGFEKEKIIKFTRPYNQESENFSLEAISLVDLFDNEEFQNKINYKNEE